MKPVPINGACRCGYEGNGPHPCHGQAYTCRKSAQQRFYAPRPVALAGVQLKFQMNETWACDECWEGFRGCASTST